VRIIAATNRDLEAMVKAKTFREDLYYRLAVVRLRLPSLRERTTDIPEIVDFMLQKLEKSKKTRVRRVAPEAMDILVRHRCPAMCASWRTPSTAARSTRRATRSSAKDLPAKLREAVQGLGASAPATAAVASAPVAAPSPAAALAEHAPVATEASAPESLEAALDFVYQRLSADKTETILERLEREMIVRANKEFGGNQVRSSERLGITRATLRKRLDALRGEKSAE
jgi:two-component system nitrogen regulation response regulator GlnG